MGLISYTIAKKAMAGFSAGRESGLWYTVDLRGTRETIHGPGFAAQPKYKRVVVFPTSGTDGHGLHTWNHSDCCNSSALSPIEAG